MNRSEPIVPRPFGGVLKICQVDLELSRRAVSLDSPVRPGGGKPPAQHCELLNWHWRATARVNARAIRAAAG